VLARAYRWLLRFMSDEMLAEDLLSEVFLDVWRRGLVGLQ
jgi:DNA-directed RNA polymerase specialized sigma24 family protein